MTFHDRSPATDAPPFADLSPEQEAEVRAGITPLDHLLDEWHTLTERTATLWAKFGAYGVAEHERKRTLTIIASAIRARATETGKKTEAQIDQEAHALCLAEMLTGRAELFRLERQMDAIQFRIQRGQGLLRMVAAEART